MALSKRIKIWVTIVTAIVLVGIGFLLFRSPAENFKTAYIEKVSEGYVLTVKGKRALMSHDPISALIGKTYIDSATFFVPRANGIINGYELPTRKGYYKMIGNITIDTNIAIVDLYVDNYDDNIKDPVTWNGTYYLEWKGQR